MAQLVHDRLLATWHTGQNSRGGRLGQGVPPLGPWDTLEWRLFMQTDIPLQRLCELSAKHNGHEGMALASLRISSQATYIP